MEHDVFGPSEQVDPSTTSSGACVVSSPSESEPSSCRMANRHRSNKMAKRAFYDQLAASAHDGQKEQVWAPSDMPDTAVALSVLAPASPSASSALPDQSSASVVVLQEDSLTVVAVAELTDARPETALSQQVASVTVSSLPMSAASPSMSAAVIPPETITEKRKLSHKQKLRAAKRLAGSSTSPLVIPHGM